MTDVEKGKKIYRQCRNCHKVGKKARNGIGPHLNDVFGRKAATVDGFRYSKAMKRAGADGLVWTIENLDMFIENPKSLVSKTRMSFRGLKDPDQRTSIIAFLRQYSDNPGDIPEAEPTSIERDPEVPAAILAITGDPEYGEYLSGECVTCHQPSGADKGIPSITSWPQRDFVVAMQAYKKQARPHPVMQMIAGRLSDEEIAALAAYFEKTETGN